MNAKATKLFNVILSKTETLNEKDLKQFQRQEVKVSFELNVSQERFNSERVVSYKVDFEKETVNVAYKIKVIEELLTEECEISLEDLQEVKAKIYSVNKLREYNFFLSDFVKLNKEKLI